MNKPPAPASAYPQYEVAAGDKQGFEKLDKAAVVLLEGDRFGQWLVAACNVRPEHAHMLITQEVTGSTLISSPDVAAFLDRKFPAIPAGRQEAIVAKVAALKATNTGPGGVNPRPTTPPHRSPPDVNEGTPAADAKSNLASTTLIEISDPSIEDLRDVLKLYPYTVSTSWSLVHLQHPIPNSHRPIVEMLCCYVFDRQQQRTVQALATALGLAEIDVQRSLQKCHAALQSLQQHQDENLESDWRAQLYEPLVELAFSRRHCLRGATIRVLQEDSRKYFNPDFIVCQLDTPDDLIYNQVKAQFTERAHRLPSCVMEFKKDDVLRDIYKVGAMQLLIMQHQEHWLKRVAEQLKANGKSGLDTIRTWLRLPYCIGVHMDRDGCTFAYLSPDANGVEQRAWLCFPLINWRDGGLLRIARIFMELELVNRSYWDSIARIMYHLNPALPLPQRPSPPEEINHVDTSKQPQDDPFELLQPRRSLRLQGKLPLRP